MELTIKKEKIDMQDNDFYLLRDFIYNTCGIFFKIDKKYLIVEKILARMNKLSIRNINDYIYYLKFHPSKDLEKKYLYEIITINETSFFRNEPQLDAFEKEILPEIIKNNTKISTKNLKIWSAGCSTGEEPYTIAIIINRVLYGMMKEWSIDIYASDINESVLERARTGIYNKYSIRNMDNNSVSVYFEKLGEDKFKIKNEYKNNIRFFNINLFDEQRVSSLPQFDVIFCRNVLIYFDINSKKKAIDNFYKLLKPYGYLLLGHSESLHGISGSFKLVLYPSALVYKKE